MRRVKQEMQHRPLPSVVVGTPRVSHASREVRARMLVAAEEIGRRRREGRGVDTSVDLLRDPRFEADDATRKLYGFPTKAEQELLDHPDGDNYAI